MHSPTSRQKGFTLIELLVVIAVIGLLASVILASLNTARGKARDAKRKATLKELSTAMEMYRNDNANYIDSVGWVSNGTLTSYLVPTYISAIDADPTATPPEGYQYWRKDYTGYTCMTLGAAAVDRYAFYAKLENPTAADLATMSGDSFDACVAANWGMNFKIGN